MINSDCRYLTYQLRQKPHKQGESVEYYTIHECRISKKVIDECPKDCEHYHSL